MNWELIWKVVFIVVIGMFAVMSVLVTVFGAFDIKQLLNKLGEEDDDSWLGP